MFDAGPGAFGHPSPNLDAAGLARHEAGDEGFSRVFVPTAGLSNSGLGPLFNNTSCEAVTSATDAVNRRADGESFTTMLFRASIPGYGDHGSPNPAGMFGGQLQLLAIPGYMPEATARVTYSDSGGRFDDGSWYSLRVPHYSFRGSSRPLPAICSRRRASRR